MTRRGKIEFDGRDLRVSPPVNPSKEVKNILGGKWIDGAWSVAPTSLNVLTLCEWYGDDILDGAPEDVQDLARMPWGFRGFNEDERAQAEDHPSWATLYEHQRVAIEYAYCNPHASNMFGVSWGLGKGAISVVAADLVDAANVLVLAPLSLGPAWRHEFARWSDRERPFKRAKAGDREPLREGVTVANHEVIQELVLRDEDGNVSQPDWITNAKRVKSWISEGPLKRDAKKNKMVPARERITRVRRDYLDVAWDLIIVDESVMLKNRRAVKADVLLALRKAAGDPFVWELSASPTTKFNDDLFKQIQILMPRAFRSYWRFAEFFTTVDKEGWGWTIEGNKPHVDPKHYLRDLVLFISEDDAGLDLPEYIEPPDGITVAPGDRQREALDSMLDEWVVELEDADEPVVADTWLSRSTRLQQLTSNLGALPKPNGNGFHKRDSIKEDMLIEFLANGDLKPPLLVWTWFVETTHSVADRLRKDTDLSVGAVTGADSTSHKDDTIAAYKDGDIDALVLQMGVGKFGHTFTHTRGIYYHDRTFDSDAYTQSRRRVRRIGLEHRPTLIVPKIANSADDLIDANLAGKLTSMASLTNANLAELLRSIRSDAS